MARTPGLRGRLPVKPAGERFAIKYVHEYLNTPFAPPAYPIDVSGGITAWGMLGNGPDPTLVPPQQPCGDCTFAGRQHYKMAKAKAGNLTESWETSPQLVTEYFAYTGGQDTGANIADLLLYWFDQGTIEAFAPVDHRHADQCDSAMAAFHGLYVGVDLTDDAEQRFSAGLEWKVSEGNQPDPELGHCILQVGSTGKLWLGHENIYVTWADLQAASKAWTATCVEEAWVIITSEDAQAANLNLPALQADIRALGGTGN